MTPPRGLAEIRAAYGDVKIERDARGGWRIISPIGWESANCTLFTHEVLDGRRLYVNRAIVEPLSAALWLSYERCPRYRIKTIGCFAVRPKRVAGQPAGVVGWPSISVHTVAAAVDINAATNPQGAELVTDMPPEWVAAWEDVGWTWGGRFPRPDAMHMQWAVGV